MHTQMKPNRSINHLKSMKTCAALLAGTVTLAASGPPAQAASFGDDLAFLQKHIDVVVLSDKSGARVAIAPAWQGRVMTSAATGNAGLSFGWINRELISSAKLQPHINVFGGEDRVWLGPEGGPFSLFFAKGTPFEFEHWFTPAALDTEPFKVISEGGSKARFRQGFALTNRLGTTFNLQVDREVRLLNTTQAWKELGVSPGAGVNLVAFESANKITNAGKQAWRKNTGLLSIWILGMFNPSPATMIVVPIKPGPETELGVPVHTDYFGPVPPEKLVVRENVLYFSGDGKYRSKIGIGPTRAKPLLGSYDAANKVLTLVQFTFKSGAGEYVNSRWQQHDNAYDGDAANSYNDGPVDGGKPLGPFYELESSSPAAALAPGKSIKHIHRTIHLVGPESELDSIARKTLGVSLKEITSALSGN